VGSADNKTKDASSLLPEKGYMVCEIDNLLGAVMP
jgi:hypothetical protein